MTRLVEHEGWHGPGGTRPPRRAFRWRLVVWAIIYPGRHQHLTPTVAGVLLIVLALGIGIAAYNASNNILFITLALLLACLILSGVLSWLNFAKLRWRMLFPAVARAGHPVVSTVELANGKKLLPTYGLECLLAARPIDDAEPAAPQTTFTARGLKVKAIMQRVNTQVEGRLQQRGRLDAEGAVTLDWAWTPTRRGQWEIELVAIGSLVPFGFFHKKLGARLQRPLTVWPEPIEYQAEAAWGARTSGRALRLARAGTGSDLQALRRYAAGDSHRLIHWKASARSGRLLVRQFAAEATERHVIHLSSAEELWPRAEQFEKAVRLTATLAEEFFQAGKLHSVCLDQEAPRPVRHARDLAAVLDELAVRNRGAVATAGGARAAKPQNVITFQPDGLSGVRALIDGRPAATA